jgi:hypothetical protein
MQAVYATLPAKEYPGADCGTANGRLVRQFHYSLQ